VNNEDGQRVGTMGKQAEVDVVEMVGLNTLVFLLRSFLMQWCNVLVLSLC